MTPQHVSGHIAWCFILVFVWPLIGNCEISDEIRGAYESGDFATVLRELRPLAETGSAEAQYILGVMHERAEGVSQDFTEATRWFQLAAEQGHADAQYNLGLAYDLGKGVSQNYTEAARWYELAAEQGLVDAQYNLAGLYYEGLGFKQDYTAAVRWYRRAAEQGHAAAQYNLGVMYENGQGVLQEFAEAARWYELAADEGLPEAQYNLSTLYIAGKGLPQDYLEAARLARNAAEQGHENAKRIISELNWLFQNEPVTVRVEAADADDTAPTPQEIVEEGTTDSGDAMARCAAYYGMAGYGLKDAEEEASALNFRYSDFMWSGAAYNFHFSRSREDSIALVETLSSRYAQSMSDEIGRDWGNFEILKEKYVRRCNWMYVYMDIMMIENIQAAAARHGVELTRDEANELLDRERPSIPSN